VKSESLKEKTHYGISACKQGKMKVLLTGATGYIGKRLLPFLVEQGYYVICCVRDKNKFHPGEAWLEFRIQDNSLIQTATFRPKGLSGRIYWYSLIPLHRIIFKGLTKKTTNYELLHE